MAVPSYSELEAVNQILRSCGQAGVTTLDGTNPDVTIARETLNEVSREVQSEGWSFNKELHYELQAETIGASVPETSVKRVKFPNDALQVDSTSTVTYDITPRIYTHVDGTTHTALYDRANHKFVEDDIEVDVTWYREFNELPRPVIEYIIARTASVVSTRIVGDSNQYTYLLQKEAFTRGVMLDYECEQGDYTFFGHSGTTNRYQSYQPYNALYR
jgi:hypothetical protein